MLPKEIADQIVDRADGVPLFIEELTKVVVESAMLTDGHSTTTRSIPPLAIPTSLIGSLLARIDRSCTYAASGADWSGAWPAVHA
jgi:predicted ATPase